MEGIGGGWLEGGDEMEVEVPSLGGLGMYEQTSASDLASELSSSGDHILEESGAEPASLVVDRNPEPAKQSYGLGIPTGSCP